tara:strand:+ start:1757 stop:2356 length:600 start_codon:yes stop_codon:yes gene_type:complete
MQPYRKTCLTKWKYEVTHSMRVFVDVSPEFCKVFKSIYSALSAKQLAGTVGNNYNVISCVDDSLENTYSIVHDYFRFRLSEKVTPEGNIIESVLCITLLEGYQWDGATKFYDFDWIIEPSGFHDAGYQLLYYLFETVGSTKEYICYRYLAEFKKTLDIELVTHCAQLNAPEWLCKLVLFGVHKLQPKLADLRGEVGIYW